MADLIKGILAKASDFDTTKRIVRPNGERSDTFAVSVLLLSKSKAWKRGYVGSAIDVTEHQLLTQELPPARSVPDGSAEAQSHGQLRVEAWYRRNCLVR